MYVVQMIVKGWNLAAEYLFLQSVCTVQQLIENIELDSQIFNGLNMAKIRNIGIPPFCHVCS